MDIPSTSVVSTSMSARRRVLYSVVCATCHESGFGSADKPSLDTLLQMLQGIIYEIGRSSRAFSELNGRTEPLVGDVVVALIEMGLSCEGISSYAMRPNRVIIPSPQVMPKQSTPRILQTGEKKQLSHYIPDYLPSFPDPHSYIRTPTYKQPVTEYEAIREKSATQKRDVERALTRFMAKTCEQSLTHSLFPDEQMNHLFPLIALKLEANPYLSALLPKDQIFDDDDAEEQLARKKELRDSEKKAKQVVTTTDNNANNGEEQASGSTVPTEQTTEQTSDANKTLNTSIADSDVLDNPYLRPIKICNSRKRNRKQFEG
jgi:transcription initiation factor TFIID subunit 8